MKTYKIKIINPNRLKEFERLNNWINCVSEYCRPLYKIYCDNQSEIKNKIKKENKDIELTIIVEETHG